MRIFAKLFFQTSAKSRSKSPETDAVKNGTGDGQDTGTDSPSPASQPITMGQIILLISDAERLATAVSKAPSTGDLFLYPQIFKLFLGIF